MDECWLVDCAADVFGTVQDELDIRALKCLARSLDKARFHKDNFF